MRCHPAGGDPSAVAAARSATLSPQRRQDEQRSGADPEHAHDLRIDAPGRSNGPDRRIVTELVIRAFRTVGVDWPPVQAGFGALEPSLQRQRLNTVAAGVADKHPGHKSMVGAQAALWMSNRLLDLGDSPACGRRPNRARRTVSPTLRSTRSARRHRGAAAGSKRAGLTCETVSTARPPSSSGNRPPVEFDAASYAASRTDQPVAENPIAVHQYPGRFTSLSSGALSAGRCKADVQWREDPGFGATARMRPSSCWPRRTPLARASQADLPLMRTSRTSPAASCSWPGVSSTRR
jgi:hypothetical protein